MARRVVRSGTPLMTTRLMEGFLRQYCSFASSTSSVPGPVRTLFPRLGQARPHVVAGQRLDQRVVQGVEEDERCAESRGLGGIEKRGRDGGVEGDGQLAFGPVLAGGLPTPCRQEQKE